MRTILRPSATIALTAIAALLVSFALIPATSSLARAAVSGEVSLDFENDSWEPWTVNGDAELVVVDDGTGENKVLSVTDREANWAGFSSPEGAFDQGVEYTFTVDVRLGGDSELRLIANEPGAGNAHIWVGNTSAVADEWVTISGTHTFGAGAATAKVYLEVQDAAVDYEVDNLVVTGVESTPVDPNPEPCEPVTSIDFEDGTTGSWVANDAATLTVTEDDGNHVLEISDREDVHFGIQSPEGVYEAGVEYTFSAEVLLPEAAEVRFVAYDEASAETYNWLSGTAVVAGEWTTVTGSYIFEAEEISTAKAYLQVHNNEDYVVDNIVVTAPCQTGDGPAPGTIAITTDFENGSLDGWELRDSGWTEENEGGPLPGEPSVELSEEEALSPSHSAKVTDRNSQGDGLRIEVTDLLEPATQYEVTASFKFAPGETPGNVWMSLQNGPSTFNTLSQFGDVFSNSEWTTVTGSFTMPTVTEGNQAWLYFETAYDGGAKGNTSTFYVDDISVVVPEPPVVEDLTPLKDTVPFPLGVAIDSRETVGAPSELLLRHFNQVSAENFMKPEAWYNANGDWEPNKGEIDSLMDFAQANDLGMYGHVLVWHSQTPAWFFQDEDGQPLTSSEADQVILRDRMETHINNVVEYLSAWGDFGVDNPIVAFDVVNEVIDDSAAYSDGMRRSEWYRILGETFVDDAFNFAKEAFANYGSEDAVKLYINDYNTEQSGKRSRYLALIDRMLDRGTPIDGIGHQFHVNLALPVSALEDAIVDASGRGLSQAVTEFDVTTGTPASEAKFVEQGYYYRDAFTIFETYQDELDFVTIWGLIDTRSWRNDMGGPLVFDGGYQAKPAYYGIVEAGGGGAEAPLPPRIRAANAFAGSVALDANAATSPVWERLPLLPIETQGEFQFRWAEDHLTVFVSVEDDSNDATDGVEFTLDGTDYAVDRSGNGDVDAVVTETSTGYDIVVHLPLASKSQSDTIAFDVRIVDGDQTAGWNTPGTNGSVTLVEPLSYLEIPHTTNAPDIDGEADALWADAPVVTTDKFVEGNTAEPGEFRTLWKDHTLYVYGEIPDDDVDVTGSDPWTQDSVELYIDGGNFKNGSYRYDDMQVRINADNVVSFGTGDEGFQGNRITSATSRYDGGWTVEVAISLLEYGGVDTFQGVDFQINGATNGSRHTIRNWADPTGAGYQSTARWGVAKLVESVSTDPGDGEPGDGEPGDGTDIITPLPEDEVTDQDKGGIEVPDYARPGDTITIHVGTEHSGVATQTFLYSEPTLIGQSIVDADGNIRVTIPADTPPGTHTIAVYDADGNLLGWDTIEIVAAGDDPLATTGAEGFLLPLTIGLLLMLAGTAMVIRRQRSLGEDAARG